MLAVVLILTLVPASTAFSQALVDQCCYLISQRLADTTEPQISLTAAQCAKTLISASSAPNANPVLRYCAGLLIPALIGLISTAAVSVDDPAKLAVISPPLDEALKALIAFFGGVPEDSKAQALGVILPTLALLLDVSRSPPTPLHTQTIPIVLVLATSAPAPFKEVTEKLESEVRETLETAVRQAIAGRQQGANQALAKRQISLRAFS